MSVMMSTKGKAMLNTITGPDIFTVSHFERVGETSKYFMCRKGLLADGKDTQIYYVRLVNSYQDYFIYR